MNGTDYVIWVYLNLLTGLPFSSLSLLQSIFHVLLSKLSENQSSSVFTEKSINKLFSAVFKSLHNLAPIFTQAFILPTFPHKFYVLLLYQTSHLSHQAPGPFQSLFPLPTMSFALLHLANSQSTSKIQFKVLVKHFFYPQLSWIWAHCSVAFIRSWNFWGHWVYLLVFVSLNSSLNRAWQVVGTQWIFVKWMKE